MSDDDMFDNMAWRWAVVRPRWLIFFPCLIGRLKKCALAGGDHGGPKPH